MINNHIHDKYEPMGRSRKQINCFLWFVLLVSMYLIPGGYHAQSPSLGAGANFKSIHQLQSIIHSNVPENVFDLSFEAAAWEEDDEHHNSQHRLNVDSHVSQIDNTYHWIASSTLKGNGAPAENIQKDNKQPLYLLYSTWKSHLCA